MEDSPHSVVAEALITDFLFFDSETEFNRALNEVDLLAQLAKEPQEFWRSLLETWVSDRIPYVLVVGRPSQKEVERLAELEDERIAAQVQLLGEDGLRRCAERLEAAVEENEVAEVPEEMLEKVCVKNVDSVNFFNLQSSCNFLLEKNSGGSRFPVNEIGLSCIFDDVKTDFVHISILMDSSYVPAPLRPLIQVLLELLFESPLERDGIVLPYETVVKELSSELINFSAGLGVGGHYLRLVNVFFKSSRAKYPSAVRLLHELLRRSIFTPERIRVVAQRRANNFEASKQDGELMSEALNMHLCHLPGSNPALSIPLRQETVVKDILKRLKTEPQQVSYCTSCSIGDSVIILLNDF